MINKYIFCLFILCQTCLASAEARPILRTLILCDTVSSNIKKASFVDIANMKKMTNVIARQLKIKKKITLIKGKKMTQAPLVNWVSTLPFSSNDIVIFYYSGHGFRLNRDVTPWPSFILGRKREKAAIVPGESIYQEVKRRSPRLAIILFDCCNFAMSSKKIIFPRQEIDLLKKGGFPGVRSLFGSTRGMITICAASPGELAIAIIGGKNKGSLFTSQFLRFLLTECRSSTPSWEKIIQNTVDSCSFVSDETQHPLSFLEISH